MRTPRAILGLTFVWVVSSCSPAPPGEASLDGAPSPRVVEPTLVETVLLETTEFRETITLTGQTEALRSAVLSSEVSGRIVRLDVEEGESVSSRRRVLRVDTGAADAQRAQLETQQAAVERDIARSEQLVERGLGTVSDLEALRTTRELLGEQIAAIEVSIQQGSGYAPIDGIVVEKLAEVGEFTGAGVPLARIVDVSTIVVRVGLAERDIGFAREGMELEVLIVATGQRRQGVLHRIGVEADQASRTFPLELHLDNEDGQLRAGMRAKVELPKRHFDSVVVVPRDATLQGMDGAEVLVDEEGVTGMRQVVLGPGRGGYTVVESGLVAGDRLIVRGHRLLVPRESIRTVDLGPCCAGQLRRVTEGAASPSGSEPAAATTDG